ncbi:MAG: flagellar protein [Proteobacteria bacterium]|nr:flagellar protein [Pseudomonadota bacterium]
MAEVEEQAPSKGGLLKIILLVLAILLVAVGSALGALFFTGFFDAKEADAAEEAIAELEAEIEGTESIQMPEKVAKETAEEEKFKPTYYTFDQPFVANVAGSRKVMQVTVAVMTYYDERVVTAIGDHKFAIQSAVLDRLRMVTEAQLREENFRRDLQEELTLIMNEVLEKFEEFKFAGIEEVYFIGFVVQ